MRHSESGELGTPPFALAGVKSGSDLDADGTRLVAIASAHRDRVGGADERGNKAVAGGVDLASAERSASAQRGERERRAVRGHSRSPSSAAVRAEPTMSVKEQRREHAIVECRRRAGEELLDLVEHHSASAPT